MNTEHLPSSGIEPNAHDKRMADVLAFYNENPRQQMKRSRYFMDTGLYDEWLSSRTDAALSEFIEQNKRRLGYIANVRGTGTHEVNKYKWRNLFYTMELLKRVHGDDIPLECYKKWFIPDTNGDDLSIQTISLEE